MRKLKHENKKRVNLRLEPRLIAALRRVADQKGAGYQTLAREWLWERVLQELDVNQKNAI